MLANEKEYQLRRRGDKDKGQPLLKTYTAFKDIFCQTADADAGVQVRVPPCSQHGVHRLADHLAVGFGALTELVQKISGDSCPQQGLRCRQ